MSAFLPIVQVSNKDTDALMNATSTSPLAGLHTAITTIFSLVDQLVFHIVVQTICQ